MNAQLYRPLIERICAEIGGIDPLLVEALIDHETRGRWDPAAIRYEQKFFDDYCDCARLGAQRLKKLNPLAGSACSYDTERRSCAFSFGLMQSMGLTVREHGFREPYLAALCQPEIGIHWGCVILKKLLDKYQSIEKALSAYNAGHAVDWNHTSYVLPIMRRYDGLKGEQTA
ncbi:MAG: lytic transglycosylase domain-containing protein [Candidatus Omnitrophota bacterium]